MVAPIDTFSAFNQAFGISYVKTYLESALSTNFRKFMYSIPGVGIAYICLEYHFYQGDITSFKIARVALASSIVGLPVLFATDVIASVGPQMIYAIKTRKKRELERFIHEPPR